MAEEKSTSEVNSPVHKHSKAERKRELAVSRTENKKCTGDVESWRISVSECHGPWQHCNLLPFWPLLVGGTLMSTTLLPGDSSCTDLSAICFCDTMW